MYTELTNYMKNYQDERIYHFPHIPKEKLENAINSYANQAKKENIIALLDDTMWGGAREGILITNKHIFAKELCKDPVKYSFSEIRRIGINKKQTIYINGNYFFHYTLLSSKSMRHFVCFFEEKIPCYDICESQNKTLPANNNAEIINEKNNLDALMEFIDIFNLKTDNCFVNIHDGLMTTANIKSMGNHVGSFMDSIFAVSVEQQNEVYRRNISEENKKLKSEALLAQQHIALAINFYEILNKKTSFCNGNNSMGNAIFLNLFSQELFTYEVLVFVLSRTARLVIQELVINQGCSAETVDNLIFLPLIDNTISPYIDVRDKSISREKTLSGMSSRNSPGEIFTDFDEKFQFYTKIKVEETIISYFSDNLTSCTRSILNSEEGYISLCDITEINSFKHCLKLFQDYVDDYLNRVVYEYISS